VFPLDTQLHSLTHLAFLAPAESEPCQCADLATVVQCCPILHALSIDTSDNNMTPPSSGQHARVLGGLKLRMSSLMAHAVCQEHLLMQLQSPTCA
jgi:hypothetical protein